MMEPTGEAPHTAGGVLCAALGHFSPGIQSHRARQAEAHDGPDQGLQSANILVGRSRDDRQQGMQEISMHLVSFVHGGHLHEFIQSVAYAYSFGRAFLVQTHQR